MSFSIERYKEESKKVDVTGMAWDDVTRYPLSKGDLFCLHYMMDIENHVPLYLSHLLVTRACMDPILTAFLACWNYEELWHGENIGRLLNLYGIEFDTQERIALRSPRASAPKPWVGVAPDRERGMGGQAAEAVTGR